MGMLMPSPQFKRRASEGVWGGDGVEGFEDDIFLPPSTLIPSYVKVWGEGEGGALATRAGGTVQVTLRIVQRRTPPPPSLN